MLTTAQEVSDLLAPMIGKTLWAALSTAQVSSAEMEPHAAEHLRYMISLEEQGALWGSGPFITPDRIVGDGLTIFNVPEESDVHRFMAEEPLTKLGLRTYTVRKWELREGKVTINLMLSRSRIALG
jgi:uncharacterized protein YciI